MDDKIVKIISIVAMSASVAGSIAMTWANGQKMENTVTKKVAEALANKEN